MYGGKIECGSLKKKINELDSLKVDFLKAYEMLTPEQFKEVTKLAKENLLLSCLIR